MMYDKIENSIQENVPSCYMQINFRVKDEMTQKSAIVKFKHTKHSFLRASQRGISNSKISSALEYGENFFKQGLIYYVLGEHNIPDSLSKEKKKLKNTVVVVAGDSNEVITCYRSKNPFKHIKMKSKILYGNYPTAA